MLKNSFGLLPLGVSFYLWISAVQAQPSSGTDFYIKDKYYAVIIGVNTYLDKTIDPLSYPVSDAIRLQEVLVGEYQFEPSAVYLLTNPTRQQIFDAFEQVDEKMGPGDNLLIFYAGHGEWNNGSGFWLPSDARKNSISQKISSNDIKLLLKQMVAKHILLIVDACYGGAIFRSGAPAIPAKTLQYMYEKSSRSAFTSGNMQPVPDQGLFADALLKKLKANPYKFLPGEILYTQVRDEVLSQETDQRPRYESITEIEDEGGDFIFFRKNGVRNAPQVTEKSLNTSLMSFYKVKVPGKGITKTVVPVKEGDKLSITANGIISVGQWVGNVTPAGKLNMDLLPFPVATNYNLNPQWPHAALIYRTSADPKSQWKLCGEGCEIIASVRGDLEIFFQLNDRQQSDNTGHFTLDISVDR